MRDGLESRRFQGSAVLGATPSAFAASETCRSLQVHADLLTFPPIAKPGPFSCLVRLLRRVFKPLIRPWLGVQTEFNRLTIEVLQGLHQEIGTLRAKAERSAELVEKCNRAVDQCYEEVKHAYDDSVNKELGHNGKISRGGLWFNPPVAVRLEDGRPVVGSISERILEQMFVHTRLPPPPARVLDLGCAESTVAIEMASFGYGVTGVDLRNLPVAHPAFKMVQADIASLPFPADAFDVVVSLSTLEHVGLGWYGSAAESSTDHRAIAEIRRVLRPGGRLILTVPYGRPAMTPVHRVYDRILLDALLSPFERREMVYGIRQGESWSLSADAEAAGRMDSTERVSAVALIVAEKP
jgi:SAM-dependent methyltransferase